MTAKIFKPAQYAIIHTNADSVTDTLENASTSLESFTVRYRSGIGLTETHAFDEDFSTPSPVDIPAGEIRDAIGEWMAVAASPAGSGNEYIVFADAFGYCPVFFAVVPGTGLVLSDSFHGVIAGLEASGVSRKLDLENYAATLTSSFEQFMNPTVHRTMAEGVRILPVDKLLLVTDSGVHLVERSLLGGATSIDSYDAALHRGIEFTHHSLTHLVEQVDTPRALLFSGGVDSRLVLSLILEAGLQDHFSIRSADPRVYKSAYSRRVFETDVVIADTIRRDFGLNWWRQRDSVSVSLDFLESLAVFQSFRSNFSFAFRPSRGMSMPKTPTLTLRGGGGEIISSTGSSFSIARKIESLGESAAESSNSAAQLTRWYMSEGTVADGQRDLVEAFVTDHFQELEGETSAEILNEHYFTTRNRTHFGHARASRSVNDIPIQFLSNPFFLRASRIIPFSERSNGRLVKDVFESAQPQLLTYPFENPEWTSRLTSGSLKQVSMKNKAWMRDFDKLKKSAPASEQVLGWGRSERGEYYSFDADQSSLTYVRGAFNTLEDLAGNSDRDTLKTLHKEVLRNIQFKKLKLPTTVSKAASAMDVFFPTQTEGPAVNLYCSQRERPLFQSTSIAWPLRPHDPWNSLSIIEQTPSIERTQDGFTVKANSPNAPVGTLFAFYLMKDGKKIAHRWFETANEAAFVINEGKGSYTVKSFARAEHERRPASIQESHPIRVV